MEAHPPPTARTALFTEAAHHIAAALIGRDCRFAGLAICVLTVAQMTEPTRALVTGGVLNLLGGGILLALAWRAPHRTLQRSEVWRSMNRDIRIAPEEATPVLRMVLRSTYLRFAGIAAWAGAWFCVMGGLYAAYIAWRMG